MENRAALLFGSATPSMEAYFAAQRGRVALLRLPERVTARPLPKVVIVDLRHETPRADEKGVPLFSAPLVDRLDEVFALSDRATVFRDGRHVIVVVTDGAVEKHVTSIFTKLGLAPSEADQATPATSTRAHAARKSSPASPSSCSTGNCR